MMGEISLWCRSASDRTAVIQGYRYRMVKEVVKCPTGAADGFPRADGREDQDCTFKDGFGKS